MTLAGLVGSIALAVINPYCRHRGLVDHAWLVDAVGHQLHPDNEYEADRIGMKTLYDAGFDPMGMANFFQKLAAEYRYASKPPEMLLGLTPPETRSSEAHARAGAMARAPCRRAWTSGWPRCASRCAMAPRRPRRCSPTSTAACRRDYPSRMPPSMARRWPCCSSSCTDEADTLMQELATRHPEDLLWWMP